MATRLETVARVKVVIKVVALRNCQYNREWRDPGDSSHQVGNVETKIRYLTSENECCENLGVH